MALQKVFVHVFVWTSTRDFEASQLFKYFKMYNYELFYLKIYTFESSQHHLKTSEINYFNTKKRTQSNTD